MWFLSRCASLTLMMLIFTCLTAGAKTWYVTDQLVVSMRQAPQDNAGVVTYLKTDVPVEVLEQSDDYVKARTSSGETGYIRLQYLTETTPKAMLIERLQQERQRLNEKIAGLERDLGLATAKSGDASQKIAADLQETRGRATALQKELAGVQAELMKVSGDYRELQKNAQNVVALTTERNALSQANQELITKVAGLEEERETLMKKGAIKWFFAGAGVLFVGWVAGKLSQGRRRSSLL